MTLQWKKILIKPTNTIREALEIINNEALRTALVINEHNKLVGVVTDGDIRRGLLNNLSLSEEIHKVMNHNPITASNHTSKRELSRLMSVHGILVIPLLDDGEVVGLETIAGLKSIKSYENPVFIMAGGFGTRLRPLTDHCPKPMLKIGDKPILEILLNQFLQAGFKNFYISTHYMPEQITDYFGNGDSYSANITYVHEDTPLGTGGALGLLPQETPVLPLIMINGDVLTTVDFERLLDFHNKYSPSATMCVREYDYQIPYGVINGDGHRITSMQEKPIQRYFVNAGIYVVSPELFKNVPAHEKIDMPTLLEKEIAKNKDVIMFPIHEYWLDIGRMDDFNKAQIDIKGLI
ncbi:TPA: nucleotidyltransferase family protein [Enterobacter cloacae]|uniref:nucleotidyltransferase family protein n=1 Tax=Enterobacter cloacae TaxID=550 RepID=UPI001255A740|nr:nucleotidyltransferase family protein [Enterobacter cloacae]VAM11649.1 glucose-1-phosphate thymidylyltransferase [Enterobacter kobei]MCK7317391.1 nucleotidyltransferase family protein [Enterobacter cloacae]UDF99415.1 nucleotidyltransferase family protein [Enterobacter cloacae]VAC86773.1 glucose-1-phosphate thymidylyltransferase [Enterobacter cloacae]HCC8047072.1 nucleotidyltransferase family protein [Enterobacter cloacae]